MRYRVDSAAECMARSSAPKPPFWSVQPKSPQHLRGSHEALLARAEDGARVHAYERGGSYAVGALILHPTFGLGVVVEQTAPGKVAVRFELGDKLLACASR